MASSPKEVKEKEKSESEEEVDALYEPESPKREEKKDYVIEIEDDTKKALRGVRRPAPLQTILNHVIQRYLEPHTYQILKARMPSMTLTFQELEKFEKTSHHIYYFFKAEAETLWKWLVSVDLLVYLFHSTEQMLQTLQLREDPYEVQTKLDDLLFHPSFILWTDVDTRQTDPGKSLISQVTVKHGSLQRKTQQEREEDHEKLLGSPLYKGIGVVAQVAESVVEFQLDPNEIKNDPKRHRLLLIVDECGIIPYFQNWYRRLQNSYASVRYKMPLGNQDHIGAVALARWRRHPSNPTLLVDQKGRYMSARRARDYPHQIEPDLALQLPLLRNPMKIRLGRRDNDSDSDSDNESTLTTIEEAKQEKDVADAAAKVEVEKVVEVGLPAVDAKASLDIILDHITTNNTPRSQVEKLVQQSRIDEKRLKETLERMIPDLMATGDYKYETPNFLENCIRFCDNTRTQYYLINFLAYKTKKKPSEIYKLFYSGSFEYLKTNKNVIEGIAKALSTELKGEIMWNDPENIERLQHLFLIHPTGFQQTVDGNTAKIGATNIFQFRKNIWTEGILEMHISKGFAARALAPPIAPMSSMVAPPGAFSIRRDGGGV